MFFNRKPPLTKLCERVSLGALENVAMDDGFLIRRNYNLGGDLKHPKRSVIIWLIMSLAAAKFWNEANTTDNPDLGLPDNPFKKTNSDVIVSEALIFFWYSFSLHVVHMKQQQQLTKADIEAVGSAGAVMMRAVKETTGWPIVGIFDARTDEYEHRNKTQNSTEVFCRVILRSLGKQAITDPYCHVDLESSLKVCLRTMIHMTARLPGYFKWYKTIVQHYPLD
jgi:hypothetical protein